MYYFLYTSSDDYDNFIETNNITEDDTNKICLICLQPQNKYNPIQNIKQLNYIVTICDCNPLIHITCFNEWFSNSASCPICRKIIYKNTFILTNNFMQNVKYFIVFFNFTIIMIRFAMFFSIINLVYLSVYNCYIMYYMKSSLLIY